MQVGKPNGKNGARFRGGEGGSIINRNTVCIEKFKSGLSLSKQNKSYNINVGHY
jgi:hypothetical protein